MESITKNTTDSIQNFDKLLDHTNDNWYLHWLQWLLHQLPLSKVALLILDEDRTGKFIAKAIWPDETAYDELLHNTAEATLKKQQPLITPLEEANHHIGSFPINVDGHLLAVITIAFEAQGEQTLHDALSVIEHCSSLLELKLLRSSLGKYKEAELRQQLIINSVAQILDEQDFEHAALRYVNLLGKQLNAERVILGFVKSGELEIHSQSDSSSYSKKHELIKLTQKAMQEVVDQQEAVVWPQFEGDQQVSLAHERLSVIQGQRAIMSVPLIDKELCYGAVLFERSGDLPFTSLEKQTAEALSNFTGQVLDEKRQSSLPLYTNISRSVEQQLAKLLGPGHLVRKLFLLITVIVSLFFSFVHGSYNLGADAVLEGAELRAIVAPYDTYLQKATYRAGDHIIKDDVLAEMDTRELRLQRMSWLSQSATARRQYEDALARQERAQVQVTNAQIQRAQAELDLLDYQLKQSVLLAPFDALIVSGDLSQRVGSIVKQGEVLFELSPADDFRLAIFVDEFRINDVTKGKTGKLVLSALQDQEVPFRVTRINPIASVRDGATVYRVEAELTGQGDGLRVGLEGVAQIYIDERLLIKVWTRSLVDWLRLQLWQFWG